MRQMKSALVGGLIAPLLLGSISLMSGCSDEPAPQTEASRDITKQKLEEMQKGMMGAAPAKGKAARK